MARSCKKKGMLAINYYEPMIGSWLMMVVEPKAIPKDSFLIRVSSDELNN